MAHFIHLWMVSHEKNYDQEHQPTSTTSQNLIKLNHGQLEEKARVLDDHATESDQHAQEQQIIESGVWIGANDRKHENSFVWMDGSLVQYTSELNYFLHFYWDWVTKFTLRERKDHKTKN